MSIVKAPNPLTATQERWFERHKQALIIHLLQKELDTAEHRFLERLEDELKYEKTRQSLLKM